MQSHNQILRASAAGDVPALSRVTREKDLIAAVQNKVWVIVYIISYIAGKCYVNMHVLCFFLSMAGRLCTWQPTMIIWRCFKNFWRGSTVKQTREIRLIL